MNENEITDLARQIRLETLKSLTQLGFGHYGGSMSVVETLAVLYGAVMKIDPADPDWPERDYFVLSKGHAGPALYSTLAIKGYFPIEEPEHAEPERDASAKSPGSPENTRRGCHHRFTGAGDLHRWRHGAVAQAGR